VSLEQRLAALEVEWPEAPDVAPRVRARLAEEPARVGLRRRLAIAAAALLVAVGGVMAVPSARSTVLDWLGSGGETIERVPEQPSPTPTPLDLGSRSSLPGDAVVPAALGAPDGVYRDGEILTLLYRPRDGLPESEHSGAGALLSQFPGRTEDVLVRKQAGPNTTIERVTVDGEPGYWLAGAAHGLIYEDPSGDIREAPQRLAGPTLVWRRGDLTLRLEADITKERALAIARSVQ
jgi:hypothetical protein